MSDKEIIAYKAFNADWTCRGFQYEVGKTYVHDGEVVKCSSGFHACVFPIDCLRYYPPTGKFAEVKISGDMQNDSDKVAASKIEIVAELSLPQFIMRAVDAIIAEATSKEANTGYRSAATNTGDWSAATNTGHRSAATNTGYRSAAKVEGRGSHAIATGIAGRAAASEGSAIYIAEYDDSGALIANFAAIVGRDGIKPDTFYTLKDGKPVEAD